MFSPLLLLLLLRLLPPVPEDSLDAAQRVAMAEAAMSYQDHAKVVQLLEPLLYPEPRTDDRALLQKAWLMLGAAHYWLGDKPAFTREMTACLMVNPEADLDPFYYPPDMVFEFQTLKAQLAETGALSRPSPPPPQPTPPPQPQTVQGSMLVKRITRVERDRSIAWVPFGMGQFASDRPVAGSLFLSTQILALGANGAAWGFMYASDGGGEHRRAATITMWSSLGLFAALAIAGIIDAQVRFPDTQVREDLETVPIPLEGPGP
jgi:hypothetical protein